ncbi:MAG: hypothetical protein HOO00_00345 [Rhodospirillaceae bacterium]|nr:hypothetical protein [Rhodospirillaceae bacterium]MBT5374373.1 hypothetical protein [Rhodospirillaceae bacterium]MBT5659089.1 hypothetical protein [Rhodospirillaceae bacterium]MBT5751708.1 hypothetical protein [Rhodospirillaceae bacterium]
MSEGKNKQNPRLKEAGTAQDSGSILGTAEVINSLAEINQRIEYLYGYADSENTDMLSAEAYSIKALARSIGLSGTRELAKGLHLACLKRNIHEARFLVESLERMAKLEAGKLQRKLKLG